MKVLVAVDDDNGMMFNHRRQSQDSVLRERILKMAENAALWINGYTKKQFGDTPQYVHVSDAPLDEAGEGEFCFVEDTGVAAYREKIEEFVIFRWNRKYPGDMKLDFFPQDQGMALVRSEDFKGSSHEKITMEVWK